MVSNNIWKFNSSLLHNKDFCEQTKTLLHEINKLDMSDINKWEWFKFKVKCLAIETGKRMTKKRLEKQRGIIEKINNFCMNTGLSTEEKSELAALQTQLDELYMDKAKGAFIRSRARWLEQGGKKIIFLWVRKTETK